MECNIGFDYDQAKNILTQHHEGKEKELIESAFDYCRKMHYGQRRKTKEPYDQHPITVALKLNSIKADYETICAALLHDTIEDCDVTEEDIANDFSPTIAKLVQGVTKVSTIDKNDKKYTDIQTINKLILSIKDDVRIILIKLMDRLHNMETINGHKEIQKRIEIAQQTLDVYVPIATLFGLFRLKEELENHCFKTIYENQFNEVLLLKREYIDNNEKLKNALYNVCYGFEKDSIPNILSAKNIDIRSVNYKYKSEYGIYRNMMSNNASDIFQVIDLITYRVTLSDEEKINLYTAMGLINGVYKPLNNDQYAFRDYVESPKYELYRGLLTYNLLCVDNQKIQIHFEYQTPSMSRAADLGIASFWNYDDLDAVRDMQAFLQGMPVYEFLKFLSVAYENNVYDGRQFYDLVKQFIFSRRIFIKLANNDSRQAYDGIKVRDFITFNKDLFTPNNIYYVNGRMVDESFMLHNNDSLTVLRNGERKVDTNLFGGVVREKTK